MTRTTAPTPNQAGRWIIPRFGPPSVLEWQTWSSLPTPGQAEALVRIMVAGEVIALGDDAHSKGLKIGDRVASMCMIGAHATHIVSPVADLLKLESTDDAIKICALPLNYMTACGMLNRSEAKLSPGSSILIGSAAGGVGTAIAQLVDAFDMNIHMIGTCSISKFDYVKSLGITPVDRHDPDLANTVRALTTEGAGVNVAYDAVGSPASLLRSHKALKAETGRLVCIGVMGHIAEDGNGMLSDLSADQLLAQTFERMSYWGVEREYYRETRDLWVKDFCKIVEKVREGKLDPVISKLWKLEDAVQANQMLVDGKGVMGKMLYVVDGEFSEKS
ncbi:Synaptic vesicle membrane protein VAT-1-like-like [Pseudocercospora fuligena]|uniref:Synaptic vesicle membrane protein VAT-1-like-like n=1 Tax=Pseudocercospora fuligena TaxID=685502 RepID=A0A8H6RDM2_9PEZI|nr:Synaptic vesicle membrane protein VAT-1-like-like [Pseudocercospora fuligena]